MPATGSWYTNRFFETRLFLTDIMTDTPANISTETALKSWDIFCRVIDNYGDIGVCWRLARQLANEYPVRVRLWVDDLAALRHIWPTAATLTDSQIMEGVEVCLWRDPFPQVEPAQVIIEAFGCELPASYIARINRVNQPQWLNLEYLSAESWVEDCHGLSSINPQTGLRKAFFFPGFTHKTGGLLCEKPLREQRMQFQASNSARRELLGQWNVDPSDNTLLISLFGYENDAVTSLLDTWRKSDRPVICLVPEGRILPLIANYLERDLSAGTQIILDQLTLVVLPFMQQSHYDRLLWCCDINFVRGEDSFVRAQWAAKPFIWHIYPQEDDAHFEKLAAFLEHYCRHQPLALSAALTDLWAAWNRGQSCEDAWNACLKELPDWQLYSEKWEQHLNNLGNLAQNMMFFCEKNL